MTLVKFFINLFIFLGVVVSVPGVFLLYRCGSISWPQNWIKPCLLLTFLHMLYCIGNLLTLTGLAFYYEFIVLE